LDYLRQHGVEAFSAFINETVIRLVSTVHPNETERNVNLMHYTNVLEKYIDWKKDFESIAHLDPSAPEYRIRREKLNQTRRAIKAEIEGVWQANQRRRDAIPVDSEARRLLERYRIIFRALPMFTKFVKGLAREAFWLYHASLHASDDKWREQFERFWHMEGQSRETKIKAVRKTFSALGVKLTPPRILNPIITFGSWKGGDRDGNPFVVASFSNQTFIEQKIFVLSHYITLTSALLDKLTTSSEQVPFSPELEQSLVQDRKKFPYITQNLKTWEPYRVKIRYMLEKLENTLRLVKSVQNSAGQTTRPLLGQTLPGPCGYNAASELKEDIDVVYHSLTMHGSKAQARSYVQDIHILVETFGLHMTAIDFRQTSDKNTVALVEYLKAMGRDEVERYGSMAEKDRQKVCRLSPYYAFGIPPKLTF
jgi:phosphoenolpyruvate carboxylase